MAVVLAVTVLVAEVVVVVVVVVVSVAITERDRNASVMHFQPMHGYFYKELLTLRTCTDT